MKKPIYKQKWFWIVIAVLFVIGAIGNIVKGKNSDAAEDPDVDQSPKTSIQSQVEPNEPDTIKDDNNSIESGTYTLPCGMKIQFFDSVRNDVTGNWRLAATSDSFVPANYALEYYNEMFSSDDEIHSIWNATLGTNTRITIAFGTLYVDTFEYVDGEEHDANLLFSGALLDSRMIDIETAEPPEPSAQANDSKQLISDALGEFYSDEQIISVSVTDIKADVKVLTDFSGDAWSEEWGAICENTVAVSSSLREAIPEDDVRYVTVYLANQNGDIFLTVSNGQVTYNKYEKLEPTPEPSVSPTKSPTTTGNSATAQGNYVLNTSTMKFHFPSCSSVSDIKAENYQDYTGSRDDLISQGYNPCGRCDP